ncbi:MULTISPECIES: dipeptidase [Bacillus]|uniref:dipeptidase n=1 Tax=Bacillus TaxID=1386 RepID=UPI000330C63E|nr:dipeptidase [Bacillus wiedmannii]EOP12756.1 microsomal dipeptidase [Bacillus cereus BAG2O-3]EOQ09454.1 microsomal dipeptidase [Bacillus cereus B5-2]EOQ27477.1 microsomal dipeptidase [Bacillus cereus BAG3O-1]MBJ8114066.1 dipeptidase [Bacillus cereus]PFW82725.1 membrane dipeptidase [Bacillus sp. AFS075960]RFB24078.1 membrane dipeptidase [Bacillus sp. LB(2018)]RFB49812.1 membrane dipeptidase [Bacillus sp. dmp10]RFB76808.1 membrane dipeptidase [Bacillus sp. AW]HDR8170494.1 dipeptidase [Baci
MKIFDAHCDVLFQLWSAQGEKNFKNDSQLHITFEQLKRRKGSIQCFAIYVPETVLYEKRFEAALQMADIFYNEILSLPGVKFIQTKNDISMLKQDEIGAILTLEGCEAIGKDAMKLRLFYRLGVRSFGLTWNYANLLADGALETRGAGLTTFGKHVVQELNTLHVWTDVSHLNERSFWDVIEIAKNPIASHSNCTKLCQHPRNLNDEQLRALIKRNSMIGVTFVPQFLTSEKQAHIADIVRHIEYICSLGGENNIGFGSDFDGILETVVNVSAYREYENVMNELCKHYAASTVERFLYDNFVEHISF